MCAVAGFIAVEIIFVYFASGNIFNFDTLFVFVLYVSFYFSKFLNSSSLLRSVLRVCTGSKHTIFCVIESTKVSGLRNYGVLLDIE